MNCRGLKLVNNQEGFWCFVNRRESFVFICQLFIHLHHVIVDIEKKKSISKSAFYRKNPPHSVGAEKSLAKHILSRLVVYHERKKKETSLRYGL